MTGGGEAEINFGGARVGYFCEFERGTGAREIYPSVDQTNKVKTKKKVIQRNFPAKIRNLNSFSDRKLVTTKKKKVCTEIQRDFPPEIRNLNGFSDRKQVISKKKSSSSQKSGNRLQILRKYRWHKSILASICTPVAPSLLISSGHNPRLGGGTMFVWGAQALIWGHGPGMPPPPVAPGLPYR